MPDLHAGSEGPWCGWFRPWTGAPWGLVCRGRTLAEARRRLRQAVRARCPASCFFVNKGERPPAGWVDESERQKYG
jgi:hypothetical protein